MATISTYVDVDVDPDDLEDDEIAEEFFRRMNRESFKEMVKRDYPLEHADIVEKAPVEVDHVARAEECYIRKQYQDVLIHLERALGWNGLSNMRLVK